MIFEMYVGVGKKWRWRLKADNGEIVAHGQGYKNKADCYDVIRSIQRVHRGTKVQDLVTGKEIVAQDLPPVSNPPEGADNQEDNMQLLSELRIVRKDPNS